MTMFFIAFNVFAIFYFSFASYYTCEKLNTCHKTMIGVWLFLPFAGSPWAGYDHRLVKISIGSVLGVDRGRSAISHL